MSILEVDLDNEAGDAVISEILIKQRQDWLDEIGNYSFTFDMANQEENDEELRRHIDAIELLLKWYATPARLKEIGLDA